MDKLLFDKKIRALYIGFNRVYIHSQTDLIHRVFNNVTDLTSYGPGFSTLENLEMGINNWIKNQPPFDVIILDGILVGFDEKLNENYYSNSFKNINEFLHFKPFQFYKFAKEYRTFFFNSTKIKFTFTTWDPYNTPQRDIDFLISSKTYVLDVFGDKLSKYSSSIIEESSYKDFFKPDFNDNWIDFETKYKHKIISFPHAIFASEFSYVPIDQKENLFSIIGVLYPERKEASRILNLRGKLNLSFIRITNFIKHKINLRATTRNIEKRRGNYHRQIENSVFCFVSGSPLQYPVRKYFEVPSKGSVPIGWPCNGFQNLGFEDGVNFIIAKENKTILDKIKTYNKEEISQIALNSQKLIFEKHSDYARISQFAKSLKLILQSKFKGSYWEGGIYKHY